MDAFAAAQDPPAIWPSACESAPGPTLAGEQVSAQDRTLVALGQALRTQGYDFTTITPASHQRVNARRPAAPASLRDVFGWNRPFAAGDLPADILGLLQEAGMVDAAGSRLRSAVRFSTIGNQLFIHSAFPTEQGDAVFFGPDTYRFVRWIAQSVAATGSRRGMRIADIGAGSGAGGLCAAALLADRTPAVVLADINHRALRFSRVNAVLNGVRRVEVVESNLFDRLDGCFDLIVSNPPYLVDPLARLYRHGGGDFGFALSLDIASQSIGRLAPGGRLLLYTGSAVVAGEDLFGIALRERLAREDLRWSYQEIDPDVFGEELEHPPYDRADRIAVVAVTVERGA
jgi:methylase of polypeptide subunit release factors